MRPLHLKVKSFTSFRDEQEVDFTDLDLFAIVGPTGSGKSSLLDAMTFALFGYADRVGKQIGQLVSQGQPRASVTLDFQVGQRRFRITRVTPASRGATKVKLERWEEGDWTQAGEGSDRVREVNAMIEDAIGLDYQAFTRAVLLPQGTFAEFLTGDPKDRRKILTELLGLELFERLAKRAGELRRASENDASARAELLETEYAGVNPEALADAERTAGEAAARETALTEAERAVREIAELGERAEAVIRDLRECATEAGSLGDVAAEVAGELAGLADRDRVLRETLDGKAALVERAAAAAGEATAARERSEAEGEGAAALAGARARAEALIADRAALARGETELAGARAEVPELERAVAEAQQLLAAENGAYEAAVAAQGEARAADELVRHANLVASVRADVHVGEQCPICGSTVAALAEVPGAGDVRAAKKALQAAERELSARDTAVRAAEKLRDTAVAAAERAASHLEAAASELERQGEQLGEREEQLDYPLAPGDAPLAAYDERIAALEALAQRERTTAAESERAQRERVEAERALDRLLGHVDRQRTILTARDVDALLRRAARAAGDEVALPEIPLGQDLPDDGPALAAVAEEISVSAHGLAAQLNGLAAGREEERAERASRAGEALADVLDPDELPSTLEATVELVATAARRAAGDAATASRDARALAERLEKSEELVAAVALLRARSERFAALTSELRADRIMEFLQFEALQVLATGGSERLGTLSDGRYRLAYEGDEFFVVDTWNGEERRSARTLSGGESFLASLALALALSEHVRSLAVTDRAPLESLFLDEGFGTLDPETLEIVVSAIEQLGGDGRMVGVITHVHELAIRLPTRIEIEKSPRGSTVAPAT